MHIRQQGSGCPPYRWCIAEIVFLDHLGRERPESPMLLLPGASAGEKKEKERIREATCAHASQRAATYLRDVM